MTAAETDQQLVVRVQKGDTRAFDMLVLKYQHKIFGLISRYVHDADEVQDVAQEAFIKAFRALPKFRGDSAFYTWLYRIAINTAKNYLVSLGVSAKQLSVISYGEEKPAAMGSNEEAWAKNRRAEFKAVK